MNNISMARALPTSVPLPMKIALVRLDYDT